MAAVVIAGLLIEMIVNAARAAPPVAGSTGPFGVGAKFLDQKGANRLCGLRFAGDPAEEIALWQFELAQGAR